MLLPSLLLNKGIHWSESFVPIKTCASIPYKTNCSSTNEDLDRFCRRAWSQLPFTLTNLNRVFKNKANIESTPSARRYPVVGAAVQQFVTLPICNVEKNWVFVLVQVLHVLNTNLILAVRLWNYLLNISRWRFFGPLSIIAPPFPVFWEFSSIFFSNERFNCFFFCR